MLGFSLPLLTHSAHATSSLSRVSLDYRQADFDGISPFLVDHDFSSYYNLTILSFFGGTSKTLYSHLFLSSLQLSRKGLTVTLNGPPPRSDTSSIRFTPKGRNAGLIQLLRTHHASLLLNPFFTLKSPMREQHLNPLW